MSLADDSNSPDFEKEMNGCLKGYGPKEGVKISLSIDRLSLMLPVHPQDQVDLKGYFMELKLQRKVGGAVGLGPAGFKAKQGSFVALHAHVPTSTSPLIWSQQTAATLQLKPAKNGKLNLRVEFGPQSLTPEGFKHVYEKVLQETLHLSPDQILAGKVTRLDLALDLWGIRLRDFAWSMQGRQIRRPWTKKGGLESMYFGSSKHGAACLYDKGKQQKLEPGIAWTRIELRPKLMHPLSTLPSLPNAFAKVMPYDIRRACLALQTAEMYREWALSTAHLSGVRELIKSFPQAKGPGGKQSLQQAFTEALEATRPKWWSPDAFWQAWPAAIAAAMPGLFPQPE